MNKNIFYKYKNIILSILFFSMMYSVAHTFAYELINDDECAPAIEFMVEYEKPTVHNDLCDTHHEFHNCYTLNSNDLAVKLDFDNFNKTTNVNLYIFNLSQFLLKPPIA